MEDPSLQLPERDDGASRGRVGRGKSNDSLGGAIAGGGDGLVDRGGGENNVTVAGPWNSLGGRSERLD